MLCGVSLVLSIAVPLAALGHSGEVQGWSACSRCSAAVSCSIPHCLQSPMPPPATQREAQAVLLLPAPGSQIRGEEKGMQFPISP